MANEPEKTKIILFIASAMIGLGAKLAHMHKDNPLTFGMVIRQSLITTMAAWLVWWLCQKYNQDETSTYIFGCITASFSHQLIMLVWEQFKTGFSKFLGGDK